ncbi:MAG: hypothetical protein DME23_13915 [Verrucomicrobia bacterium]|nr:MAG: hypothetical protein DME23_13915 [Verrucomicrobiota bacterium]
MGSGKRWQLWQTVCAKVAPRSISDRPTMASGWPWLFVATPVLAEFLAAERAFKSWDSPAPQVKPLSKKSEPNAAPARQRP